MSDLLARFRKVDVSGYPDVHLFVEDLDVVLWVLLVGSERVGLEAMSAAAIADVITHVYRRDLSRQRVTAVIKGAKGLVTVALRSEMPSRFTVLRAGIDRVRGKAGDVTIVNPEEALSAIYRLEQILEGTAGQVSICDPYVDEKTLLALTAIQRDRSVRLLTLNVSDPAAFRRKLRAYETEYGNLELRVNATPDIHDRFMIDDNSMWLFGQSLNGIGKKQSMIVKMGSDVRYAMQRDFDRRWNGASRWS